MSTLGAAVAGNGFRPGDKCRSKAAVGGRQGVTSTGAGLAGTRFPTPARGLQEVDDVLLLPFLEPLES